MLLAMEGEQRMIASSNYEVDRCQHKKLPVKSTDVAIFGDFKLYFAPMKRKIDNKKLFQQDLIGRNNYDYQRESDAFFVNNKLKVVDMITNRVVTAQKLTFRHYDGRCINVQEEKLNVNSIMTAFSSPQFAPQNIFTNHPIVCELFHFLISNFYYYSSDRKIVLHYVKNLRNNDNVFSTLQKRKFHFKSRAAIPNNNHHHHHHSVYKKKYLFKDQSIVIVDDNNNDVSPKVFINVPRKYVNSKYFSRDPKEMNYFIKKKFFVHMNKGFNKYFNH